MLQLLCGTTVLYLPGSLKVIVWWMWTVVILLDWGFDVLLQDEQWKWWKCVPEIKAYFIQPGILQVFWDLPPPEFRSLVQGYQVLGGHKTGISSQWWRTLVKCDQHATHTGVLLWLLITSECSFSNKKMPKVLKSLTFCSCIHVGFSSFITMSVTRGTGRMARINISILTLCSPNAHGFLHKPMHQNVVEQFTKV